MTDGAGDVIVSVRAPRKRRRGRLTLIGLSVASVAMLCIPAIGPARFVWNVTPSAPPGVYSIEHENWHVGDRVAVKPPDALAVDLDARGILARGKLLIKRVAAAEGDEVCRAGESVTVNGALAAIARISTASGSVLPVWGGCRKLRRDDVFLLGDTADSYDGRYFGLSSVHDVIGRASLIVAF